ncbi:hypothetical protein F7725_004273 [Dissostichus mawsoni]|uniref:Integrase core domain-containing protein n=1 Tax=Dissostichus mawsoni TaxID=36200 RepID=A0A7J5XJN2_DISMA|nr:hypothetical protein F7725_004273 [Dissostichus mawsoni]
MKRDFLQRLLTRISQITQRLPLDVDYLQFAVDQEMALFRSLSGQDDMPQDVINALTELSRLVNIEDISNQTPHQSYSTLTDDELDNLVLSVKARTPHVGYRMMKGILKAMGHRVQWKRVSSSMHRVDSVGVLTRMARMGCVARRTHSVQGPLHLVHIDTNHKLIRYGLVISGGIDGFSRKIMYLGAATNNKASTSLDFFLEGVQKYGFPLRIERLWRDVWMAVSNVHYEVLHSLEDEASTCSVPSMYFFHVLRDLNVFRMGWDNHPLRTERNLSPHQLWTMGLLHNPIDVPDLAEEMEDADLDFNTASEPDETSSGVILPPVESPLSEQDMAGLLANIDVTRPSGSYGRDIYLAVLNHVLNHAS